MQKYLEFTFKGFNSNKSKTKYRFKLNSLNSLCCSEQTAAVHNVWINQTDKRSNSWCKLIWKVSVITCFYCGPTKKKRILSSQGWKESLWHFKMQVFTGVVCSTMKIIPIYLSPCHVFKMTFLSELWLNG